MHPWWENWGWWKMSDDPQEPQPRSYDIGVITPAKRDRLLDAIRRHPTLDNIKKDLVDLLETAQPTDMEPGRLCWSDLEREVKRMGPHWGWADVFERMGKKRK